jgi:protease-4
MKKLLIILLVLMGLFAVVVGGLVAIFGISRWAGQDNVASGTVLQINLEMPFNEYIPDSPAAEVFAGGGAKVRDLVEALDRAAGDGRVVGIVARVGAGTSGMAITQEIRDAVLAFRDSGKFAVAYAETIGEAGPGNVGYYAATAFEEIWLQPSGDVSLTGLMSETPFISGALEKLEITPRFDHRYEFKNAMSLFTEKNMTAAHREAMSQLIDSQFGQMVAAIAEARNMTEDEARGMFDHGPFMGQQAVDAGLVDGLRYRDEVRDDIRDRVGGGTEFVDWDSYLKRAGRSNDSGTGVALIYGVGNILRGESGYNPVLGNLVMGSDSVTAALRDAIDDDDIHAIVFRVDCPGGSAVASESVRREIVRARDAGKPVVVTMGNVAASGGYWVSVNADRIIAQPATITASIGVLNGKFLTTSFWNNLGITFDNVQTSDFSTHYSSSYDFTESGWAYFQSWLDRIYEEFTQRVAEGRDMPLEDVLKIAKGHIWTGEDALNLGLVDELGGFPSALAAVRELLNLTPGAPLNLTLLPREKTTFEKLSSFMESSTASTAASTAAIETLRAMQPAVRSVGQVAVPPEQRGVVHAPALPDVE